MHKLKIYLPLLLTLCFFQTNAQQELTLSQLSGLWQANKVNPAFMPDQKVVISLPGVHNNLSLVGPTYEDVIVKENGKTLIDIDRAILAMEAENRIREDLQIESLGAAIRFGNLMLSVGHSLRTSAWLLYPKELPQVIWQGNAQFVGQDVVLDTDIQLQSFQEIAFGVAYKFGKLTIGAKAKYLNGIDDASSNLDRQALSLYTSDDIYQLSAKTNYQLNTAGAVTYDGFSDFDLNFNFGDVTGSDFFSENTGWAFDFGASLELNKLTLSASVLDIGSLEWTDGVTNYNTNGTFNYDGLDISGVLTGEDVSLSNALDTLENILEVTETKNSYSTDLPRKAYLQAAYQLTDKFKLSATYFNESFRNQTYQAVGFGANWDVLPILSLGASYSTLLETDKHFNIGVSAVANLGPVQIYAVTDNILGAIQIETTQQLSARVGLNLKFGKANRVVTEVED